MRIPAHASIVECEKALWEMHCALGESPLELPTHLQYLGAGGEAALIQIILSWAARQQRPLLKTNASDRFDPQITAFLGRLAGLVASIACHTAKGRPSSIDLTQFLKSRTEDALRARYGKQTISLTNRSVEILCADTLGYGAPRLVYDLSADKSKILRTIGQFNALARDILTALVGENQRGNMNTQMRDAIGGLIFELFSNTHDHGTTGIDGKTPIPFSVRGIQVRRHAADLQSWERITEGFAPLTRYFKALDEARSAGERGSESRPERAIGEPGRHLQVVEVSIFDAGIGLAQKWLETSLDLISLEDEEQAVIQCFEKGKSTKSHRRYGQGLPLVIRLLRQRGGFIRLRTGRLSLYSDLLSDPGEDSEAPPQFRKWLRNGNLPLAPVTGTLVTVLAPIY